MGHCCNRLHPVCFKAPNKKQAIRPWEKFSNCWGGAVVISPEVLKAMNQKLTEIVNLLEDIINSLKARSFYSYR